MKIKFIRSDIEVAASYHDNPQVITCERGLKWWPIGAIVDVDASGKYLVENCDADPYDDEMKALCTGWENLRTEDDFVRREMLAKCIDPEDRQRFRNGEILGYDADGNDIPGPNYVEPDEDSEDEEDDE